MNPTRLPKPSTVVKPPHISPWEPIRLVAAGLGGLLVLAFFYLYALNEYDTGLFVTFLKGQTGFSGFYSSDLFWKMALGFGIGAVLGYGIGFLLSLEIPAAHRQTVNSVAMALALFLIPVVVYIPAMSAGFIWDDDQEIAANPSLQHRPSESKPNEFGTNWYGLWEIWTGGITNDRRETEAKEKGEELKTPLLVAALRPPLRAIERSVFGGEKKAEYRFRANESADYFPLKTTFLWLEFQLWGHEDAPTGQSISLAPPFHVMNIIFHALDGLLLWMVLRQLKVPGAWLGSLLFAIHPVHAESVAWIAERKNTLSLFFCLLSLSAWLRFEDSEKRKFYIWALVLFAASLLCKTHVVVFPAVLLLITWWKTGTLTLRDAKRSVPFFVVAVTLALVTIWFQNDRAIGGERIPIGDWSSRLAGAGVVTWAYLGKVLLPINLNTIYANTDYLWWPLTNPKPWMFLAGAAVLMSFPLMWAINVLYPTRNPITGRTPFFVFAFFVGTLFPVLGFFTMSYMRLTLQADHFQYFSDISILALAGAIIATLYEKAKAARPIVVSACLVIVFSFCAYSWERAGVHQSEKTLWTACLEKNEASWQAHNHIGAVLYTEQKPTEAAPHFARAVELKPENPEVHNNLGLVLWHAGQQEKAIAEYREAVRIKGDVIALRQNLANALVTVKRYDEAVEQYQVMLKEMPKDTNLRVNLGVVFAQMGRYAEAKRELETVLKINPNHDGARQNMDLLRRMGQ